MQYLAEDSSPEIPARRSISDPAITPRESHRVGTPYPKAKKQLPPSRIPRLATGIHNSTTVVSRNKFTLRRAYPPVGSRTEFHSTQPPPSVATIFQPRELVVTPFPDPGQESYEPPGSPPVIQLYRQSSRVRKHFKAQPTFSCQNKVLSRGLEAKSRASVCTPALHQNHSINFPIRKQKVLDCEGYLQGPHSIHNRRIYIYKKPDTENPCENDHGDCLSARGRPPLPPNVFRNSVQSKPRLATATISQGNTLLESYPGSACSNNFCQSRASSRSGLYSPQYSHSHYSPLQQSPRLNPAFARSPSSTSVLSKIHEAESCTNLLSKTPIPPPDSSIKCPLCSERGTCNLHHKTMCSRYMTDLEWRICHAVNIYVYKNGEEGQTPVLIHIPPSKKKNMRCVMSVIQERICYPIGYAKYLYRMNGKKVTNPCELEMYNNYVVASNYDKCFKCVCYSRRKSPLLVLAKESKHVRELRLKNYQYELYLARKRCGEERLACDGDYCGQQDFYGPTPPVANPAAQIGAGFRTQPPLMPSKCPSKRKKCLDSDHVPGSIMVYPGLDQYEYTVNTCTITTAPLKDPEMLKKSNDSDAMMTPTGRYKGIINDDDSLFYSAKKKKPNGGVIDVSTEKKKFFFSENDRHSVGDSDADEQQRREFNPVYSTEEVSENETPNNTFKSIKTVRLEQAVPKDSHLFRDSSPAGGIKIEGGPKGDAKPPIEMPRGKLSEIAGSSNQAEGNHEGEIAMDESKPATASLQNDSLQSIPCEGSVVSAQSRSYTILGTAGDSSGENQQNMHANRQMISQASTLDSTSFHQKSSQNTVAKAEGMQLSVAPPSGLSFKDINNNLITNVKSSRKINPEMSQFQPDVNLYTVSTSPSIYLARNQPYPCYGPGPTNYYVQQGSTQKHSQAHIQQIYPMEVLSQRQPYGSIVMDGNTRYRPHESPSYGNCYSTDEVDIPFSPLYQRNLVEPMTPYVQVPPPYITTNNNNQQFNYHRADAPSYTTSRNLGLVAIRKPSKRNVAIQMGEPSSLESQANLQPYDSSQPGVPSNSPRLQQPQIFYQTPNYFYSPPNQTSPNNVSAPVQSISTQAENVSQQDHHRRQQQTQRSNHQQPSHLPPIQHQPHRQQQQQTHPQEEQQNHQQSLPHQQQQHHPRQHHQNIPQQHQQNHNPQHQQTYPQPTDHQQHHSSQQQNFSHQQQQQQHYQPSQQQHYQSHQPLLKPNQHQHYNPEISDSVLPPPTGYRDGLYENRSGRAYAKHSSRSVKQDERISNKENNEYLQIKDTRQSRAWKK